MTLRHPSPSFFEILKPKAFFFCFSLIFITLLNSTVLYSQLRDGAISVPKGEALEFISSEEYNLLALGSFTIETWVQLKGDSDNDACIFNLKSGENKFAVSLNYSTNEMYVQIKNSSTDGERYGWTYYLSNFKLLNNWEHFAFSTDGNNNIKIYLNGNLILHKELYFKGNPITILPFAYPEPSEGNIGGYDLDNYSGALWLNEIRVWNTRLSSTTIKKYFDEEVNVSHPNWASLFRYYHGTHYIEAGWIGDVTRRWDVQATLISGYAPVKPGAFNNNSILTDLNSTNCEKPYIRVNWSNFGDRIKYQTGLRARYIVKNKSNQTIFNGYDTSFNHNLGAGKSETYTLRTYFNINGVKHYSDDALETYGTSSSDSIPKATINVTTERCDENIIIEWSENSTINPPKWQIQRSSDSLFKDDVVTLNSNINGSERSFTTSPPEFDTDYFFRVNPTGTYANGCAPVGEFGLSAKGRASRPPSPATKFQLTQDVQNLKLILNWEYPIGNTQENWLIRRTFPDGSNLLEFVVDGAVTTLEQTGLQLCQTYNYSIAAINTCAPEGVFSNVEIAGNISQDLTNFIGDFQVSKGYFKDHNRLSWSINGDLSQIERFRIERSFAGQNNFSLVKIVVEDLIYEDKSALGGVFYDYRIYGEAKCEEEIITTNIGSNLGFYNPYGVANGHVEYQGGNPVEGVAINFNRQNGPSGNSLKFDGHFDYVSTGWNPDFQDNFTTEFWMKAEESTINVTSIIGQGNWNITLNWSNGRLRFNVQEENSAISNFVDGKIKLNDLQWHHISCVKSEDSIFIYVDGDLDVSAPSPSMAATTSKLFIGRVDSGNYNFYKGWLDEIRLWKIPKSHDEIRGDYNRVINGSEDGLVALWRCDEGTGRGIYDASKTGLNFNKHDANLVGQARFSPEIPLNTQFGITGVTNKFGDYSLNYIPYSEGGEVFRVTPSFGQHKFEPNSKTVFIGDGAQTQNGLDFKDISSFKVQGKITYHNSEFPVSGASIFVDGREAFNTENKPAKTDNEGNYEIRVPIGQHYISVSKEGHYFSAGVFPKRDSDGQINYHEFLEPIVVNFVDSTFIKVAGRVVGGDREGDKKILFGKSVNNIGVSNIDFITQREGYDLNLSDSTLYNTVNVTTDPITGEFSAFLIPENFIVENVGNSNYLFNKADIPLLDLRNSTEKISLIDTLEIKNDFDSVIGITIDTAFYHKKLNYIYYETPNITVHNELNQNFSGDTAINFLNRITKEPDVFILNDSIREALNVFQTGKSYKAKIYVNETYKNSNHPNGEVLDNVPVHNAEIFINNNLSIAEGSIRDKTDQNGYFEYVFVAGLPNLNDGENAYTKTFEIDLTINGVTSSWLNGDLFRGYILGESPIDGTNFVTFGPEVVDFVLRDPPGSYSYAFIEKGSSFSTKESWNFNIASNSNLDFTIRKGISAAFGGGLAGPVVKLETINDSKFGTTLKKEFNYGGEFIETTTFNERIQTSSDPLNVGAMADVFVGRAQNAYMSQSKNFKLLKTDFCLENNLTHFQIDSLFSFGIIDGYVFTDGTTSTMFIYSQAHIINELIPNLVVQRDLLFQKDKYEANFPPLHKFYGLNNDNHSLQSMADSLGVDIDTAQISYKFHREGPEDMDSVLFLNTQVSLWMNAIARNEAEKAMANTVENISIDGASGAYLNEINEESNSTLNNTTANSITMNSHSTLGFLANSAGFKMETRSSLMFNVTNRDGKNVKRGLKFGYVLDERDHGDYYSIDVKYTNGVQVYSEKNFSDFLGNKDDFIKERINTAILGGGVGIGGATAKMGLYKTLTYKMVDIKLKANLNAGVKAVFFAVKLGYQIYEMVDMTNHALNVYDKVEGNNKYDLAGFAISSPIFSITGGQSQCPYEPGEESYFYVDPGTQEPVELSTPTLQKEVPVIDIEPAFVANVPDFQKATFKLLLKNESASNSPNWYNLRIDEDSNPDGAVLKIDGLNPKRAFFIEPFETLEKTLTISKGKPDVMHYDSLALILTSQCQYNPETYQEVIADTVYFSVHFTPTCTDVEIKNMQDNWLVNYDNNNQVNITLDKFDINHGALESIKFEYSRIGGSPITPMAWFKDPASKVYANYNGEKDSINGQSEISFNWDVQDLNDKQYLLRAKTTCVDGSVYEADYITGLFDRKPPRIFGTPEPADGILSAGENILIQFDEKIEAGLVKEHNISLMGVLNGSEISHGTSVDFDGINDYASIPGISLNQKPFTIEFWMQREIASSGTIFSKGYQKDKIELNVVENGFFELKIGENTFEIDPSDLYSTTYPEDFWHHYAISYDQEMGDLNFYLDDNVGLAKGGVTFNSSNNEALTLGTNSTRNNPGEFKLHEFRVWDQARDKGEVVSIMSNTLSGAELGLFGYWPMNNAKGNLIEDKVSGKHMRVNATWSVYPQGNSFEFNGTDEVLTLDSSQIIITSETDFAIEFWFKGDKPTSEITLFSNGLGDGVEYYTNPELSLRIAANAAGEISVFSNGYQFNAATNNYFDNDWHHFVLSVDRRTNANVFIDGNLTGSVRSDQIAGLAGAKMWLGARGVRVNPIKDSLDQYFDGFIDEFRVWGTSRSKAQIDRYSNTKLSGEEAGLLSYIPFEKYINTSGTFVIKQTLQDQTVFDNGQFTHAESVNNSFSEVVPTIQDARPLQPIPFDYVINNDKIIITPTVAANRIENTILDISIKDIQDVNSNRMLSPASWTAFIDQNQVVWEDNALTFTKKEGDTLSFTNVIENLGGISYEYQLLNLPSWLSPSETFGTISPTEKKPVSFQVDPGLNIGSYENIISLRTSFGFDEKLLLKIRVIKDAPEWEVNPEDFKYSMNITGQILIDNIISTDKYDKAAAFIDGKCVGVANLEYLSAFDRYEVFLNIYHNSSDAGDIQFKIWDASRGREHANVNPKIPFSANAIMGSASDPVSLIADNTIAKTLDLKTGWNWLSFNLNDADFKKVNSTLEGIGTNGDLIKSFTTFDQYDEGVWSGDLSNAGGLNHVYGYKMYLSAASKLQRIGLPIDPATNAINVLNGWNLIGYPVQVNLTVNEALTSFTATHGDVIKSQKAFAQYDENIGWIGSLSHFEPNKGYMLRAEKGMEFTFPQTGSLFKTGLPEEVVIPKQWNLDVHQYSNNMSLTANIVNDEASILTNKEVLLAFNGDNCVGYAKSIDGIYYVTLYGKVESAVTFKLYDEKKELFYAIMDTVIYNANDVSGTYKAPTPLRLIKNSSGQAIGLSKVNPNPFRDNLNITFTNKDAKVEAISVYNSLGQLVYHLNTTNLDLNNSFIWNGKSNNADSLPNGAYFMTIRYTNQIETHQLLKLK